MQHKDEIMGHLVRIEITNKRDMLATPCRVTQRDFSYKGDIKYFFATINDRPFIYFY